MESNSVPNFEQPKAGPTARKLNSFQAVLLFNIFQATLVSYNLIFNFFFKKVFFLGLSFANKHPFFFLLYETHPRKNHWLRLTGFEGFLGTLFDSKDKKRKRRQLLKHQRKSDNSIYFLSFCFSPKTEMVVL